MLWSDYAALRLQVYSRVVLTSYQAISPIFVGPGCCPYLYLLLPFASLALLLKRVADYFSSFLLYLRIRFLSILFSSSIASCGVGSVAYMGFERGSVGKISWFCCSPRPSRGDDIHLDLGGLSEPARSFRRSGRYDGRKAPCMRRRRLHYSAPCTCYSENNKNTKYLCRHYHSIITDMNNNK